VAGEGCSAAEAGYLTTEITEDTEEEAILE
jgi:hypothetical protein